MSVYLVEGRVPFNRLSAHLLRKPKELHVTRVEDTHWDTFCHEQSSFQLGKGPLKKQVQTWLSPHRWSSFLSAGDPGPPQGGMGPPQNWGEEAGGWLGSEARPQAAVLWWIRGLCEAGRVGKQVLAQLLASEVHPQSHPAGRWEEDSDSHCRRGARDAGWPEPNLKQLTVYVSSCCLSTSHTGCLLPQECTFLMAKQTPPKTHLKNTKGKLKIKSGHQKLK